MSSPLRYDQVYELFLDHFDPLMRPQLRQATFHGSMHVYAQRMYYLRVKLDGIPVRGHAFAECMDIAQAWPEEPDAVQLRFLKVSTLEIGFERVSTVEAARELFARLFPGDGKRARDDDSEPSAKRARE